MDQRVSYVFRTPAGKKKYYNSVKPYNPLPPSPGAAYVQAERITPPPVADKGVRSSDEQRSDASGSEAEGLLRIAGAKQLLQKTKLTPTGQEDKKMTLTERKTNPEITKMFVETLTKPEMEKAAGGGILDALDAVWNMAKCDVFDDHNWVWNGQWTDIDRAWYTTGHKVMVCTRCGKTETDGEVYVIINR